MPVPFLTCRSFNISNLIEFNSNFKLCPLSSTTLRTLLASTKIYSFSRPFGKLNEIEGSRTGKGLDTGSSPEEKNGSNRNRHWKSDSWGEGLREGCSYIFKLEVCGQFIGPSPMNKMFFTHPPAFTAHSPLSPISLLAELRGHFSLTLAWTGDRPCLGLFQVMFWFIFSPGILSSAVFLFTFPRHPLSAFVVVVSDSPFVPPSSSQTPSCWSSPFYSLGLTPLLTSFPYLLPNTSPVDGVCARGGSYSCKISYSINRHH